MENTRNQWKSIEIIGNQLKSMEIYGTPLEIIGNPSGIHGNLWKAMGS